MYLHSVPYVTAQKKQNKKTAQSASFNYILLLLTVFVLGDNDRTNEQILYATALHLTRLIQTWVT